MAIILIFLACAINLLAGDPPAAAARTPVLVELFTSEGCSDCPPADRLLLGLEQLQPVKGVEIIVVSEHVDYFDSEGWHDPFDSPQWTARQREYSYALHAPNVFTPQMIVDGRVQFIGNMTNVALQEIAKEAGRAVATIGISHAAADGALLTAAVTVQNIPAEAGKGPFDLMVAVTEEGLHSKPDSGENKGAPLSHAEVLRSLSREGKVAASAGFESEIHVKLGKSWKRESLRVVVFVQDHKTLLVWGVAQAPLSR